jgi:hypothetical protein
MNTQFTINRRKVLKGLTAGMAAAAAGPTLFSSRLWGAAAPGDRLNNGTPGKFTVEMNGGTAIHSVIAWNLPIKRKQKGQR